MKQYFKQRFPGRKILVIILLSVLISACDKNFEAMNINPNAYNEPVLSNLFSMSIVNMAGPGDARDWGNGMYAGGIMQYYSSVDRHLTGEKYLYDPGYNDVFFNAGYQSHLKELQQIISLIKDDPERTNLYAMARIMRVYAFHQITDFYGDIPYFEAGNGYIEGNFKPKYDKQSDIYTDMLKQLEESAILLDASKQTIGAADFIYNGDVTKWKRFTYSLMLRLAMRLTKVDPSMAETYVKKAIAGGVMESNEDVAKLEHTNQTSLNWNLDSYYQNFEELRKGSTGTARTSKLSKTFVDFLKDNDDPRLPFYATLLQGNEDPSQLPASSVPALQKGLPPGYDLTTIKTIIPGWTDDMYNEYSELNLNTIADMAAPSIFQSYAEVELLLTEATIRGWNSGGGNAKTHYDNAVAAAMTMVNLFPGGMSISSAAISEYLDSHPFLSGDFEKQMEQIGYQYWVVHCFVDNIEGFANWRRTNYPSLVPTNYPGNVTGGVIPRRLLYPESTKILNTDNYNAAIQVQGPDLYTTRIWWDKP